LRYGSFVDVRQVGNLARHFPDWQGLHWVPTGLGGALFGVLLLGGGVGGIGGWLVILAVVLVVADIGVDVYYQEWFGRVRAERTRRLRNAAGRIVAMVATAAAAIVDLRLRLPVQLTGLAFAAAMVAYWWATGRARRHWLVLALAPFAAAFVPVAGVAPAGRSSIGLLLVVIGTVEVLGGLRDHMMLLAKIREVQHGLRG
jgi:hypothetical protein